MLAIPRGGVVVGAAAAPAIGAELDVAVPAKVRAPSQPELAIGAVAPDGTLWLDAEAVRSLAIPPEILEAQVEGARREVDRRTTAFRGDRPPPEVADRPVVVVDDGIATGATILATARSIRGLGASLLVIGVPVAPRSSLGRLGEEVDRVVCLASPEPFFAVGQWYEDFRQVDDDAVRQVLAARSTD
jgi:predicted phosphoribosyltransferase